MGRKPQPRPQAKRLLALKGIADVDGTIKALTVDPDLATPSVDVAGLIKSLPRKTTDGYTAPSC